MTKPSRSLETELIHAGENPARQQGAVVTPIYQSATYLYQGEVRYSDVRYVRLNNTPNHLALHEKLAVIEHGEAALVTSSGMAAITSTLLTVLRSGDHLLAQNNLYGGTLGFELDSDVAGADAFLEGLELATVAPSLGGVETLVTRPATTSHSGLTPEERAAFGISDTLIRVSVGIEHKNDLLRDFSRGLES